MICKVGDLPSLYCAKCKVIEHIAQEREAKSKLPHQVASNYTTVRKKQKTALAIVTGGLEPPIENWRILSKEFMKKSTLQNSPKLLNIVSLKCEKTLFCSSVILADKFLRLKNSINFSNLPHCKFQK